MKSFNNYLLTHHPLLWNLRLHWVWPVIIALHILFAIGGYASVDYPQSLAWYSLRAQGGTVSMAILSGILIGVLWLLLYFRNNAFKSFYPLPVGRLMAEAALIFITVIGLTTFTATYEEAVYTHIRSLTTGTDLRREADVTNLAHHFIPFSRESFSTKQDCLYRMSNGQTLPDTVAADIQEPDTAYYRSAAPIGVDTFSYLHYCNQDVSVSDVPGARSSTGTDSIARRWLLGGRKDSVRVAIEQYLALCKKYGVRYRFDAAKQANAVFATPGFLIGSEVSRSEYGMETYTEDGSVAPSRARTENFIEENKVNEALYAIEQARKGWLDSSGALFLLYFSLGIAVTIFSFRITQVRPWFIALIGAGIWMAIFGVLAATLGRSDSGYVMMLIFMVLSVTFLTFSIYLIGRREAKRNAGVMLLWAFWSIPALLPLLASWIEHLTQPVYAPVGRPMVEQTSPLHDWISANWTIIGFGNFVLFIAATAFLFIPLARKWQAMPEE